MPSPFPGMDPYLEDPDLFPDFHETFVVKLKEAIQLLLPEPYYAASGSRIWIEYARRRIVPDVALMEKKKDRRDTGKLAVANAVAMLEEEGAVFVGVPQDEVREAYLEIYRKKGDQHRLVTSIELLSPGNKTAGQELRRQYLRKQREILRSKTSLIEIDLLHTGKHTTAVPIDFMRKTGPIDYHISLHPFHALGDFYIYPIRLQDRLPKLIVPLLPKDGAVKVNLQSVFDSTFKGCRFDRRIEYADTRPLAVLCAENARWARKLLKEKKLLTA